MKTFNNSFFISLVILALIPTIPTIGQPGIPVPVIQSAWWQIVDEDFDAGPFSHKPHPGEPTRRHHQEVSDFTIYKDVYGKWQLLSAVRNTLFPAGKHFLMRWESNDITLPNWEGKGIFWTTHDFPPEAGYAEGVFYAPHCVHDEGVFCLFHNSAGTAHLLTSQNGIDFQPYRDKQGSYILFDAGIAGRDLMVLDNRSRDGLWYVYYTSEDWSRPELATRQFTDVYARTAKKLTGPWSDPVAVGMGTPDRPRQIKHSTSDFVNAESPFVIFHEGYYYKFEQGHVVASNDPLDFEGKPLVANLFPDFTYPGDWWPALAPEIIVDGDKMYIAYFMNHHEHPLRSLKQGGVFVAELGWRK